MGYCIGATEHPGVAVRRIAAEQTRAALQEIRETDQGVDWRLHQLRKRCKRIRALVRLVRPAFDEYKAVNACFRDIARRVSDHRDARVIAELAIELGAIDDKDGRCDHAAARWYWARCEIAEEHAETVLNELEPILAEAAIGIEEWKVAKIDVDGAIAGLGKTLGRAHDGYRKVGPGSTAEAFHEWRKRAKYHRLHTQLLEKILPDGEGDRRQSFKRLDGLVGDAHDCSVLIESLSSESSFLNQRAEVRELIAVAMKRRRELRRQALQAADGLFDESAKDFCERVRASWHAANSLL